MRWIDLLKIPVIILKDLSLEEFFKMLEIYPFPLHKTYLLLEIQLHGFIPSNLISGRFYGSIPGHIH